MNIFFSAVRRFVNKLWYDDDQLDEPVVTYNIGSKRINDENINEDVHIKRRKISPSVDAAVIDVDLTEPSPDTIFPHIMPRHKKRKDKRTGLNKNDHVDTIEVIDDDDVESTNDEVASTSSDVEVVEEIPNTRNQKRSVISSLPADTEMARSYRASKYEDTRRSSDVKSYLTFSSIQIPNLRSLRSNQESRTLRELNNRSSGSSGYPSEKIYKNTTTLTTPAPSSRTISRSIKDKLMIDKLKKSHDRTTFLNLVKQYAYSPDAKRQSASRKSPVSSTRQSISTYDSGQSNRTFGTFDSKQSNLSFDSKQSNNSLEFSPGRRYYTRFQDMSQNNRSVLVPPRRAIASTSSKDLNKSAINKTVIDLTSEEDDESQRQEIVSNVVSSDYIRNLKTSFVGKDKKIIESDYIYNILKKYEAALASNEIKTQKLKQQIRERSSDVNQSISEILEKRLILKEHEAEEEIEQKPAFELAPITQTMTEAINQFVASKKVPLVQIKDTSVKLQDIKTLEHCAWLNDEVINAYMNLIKMRAEKNPKKYPKVHCFNTFLYEQLQKKGYNSVRRWTKKIDIFDFNMLIIPIHLGNHWCLIQIKIKEKCIRYFDSMGSPNNHCLKSMMQYLVDEYKDKKNGDLDAGEWQLINMPSSEIPQQRNMHDCGVFACTFAEHLTRQAPLNFSQENMRYFRLKMMYEILNAELLL